MRVAGIYRELAEAEWRKLKPRDAKDGYDAHRSRITRIMERLAEAGGDVEEMVAIKSRDLSSGYIYLDIAEIWAKVKQPDKALEWAERGLKAFPETLLASGPRSWKWPLHASHHGIARTLDLRLE